MITPNLSSEYFVANGFQIDTTHIGPSRLVSVFPAVDCPEKVAQLRDCYEMFQREIQPRPHATDIGLTRIRRLSVVIDVFRRSSDKECVNDVSRSVKKSTVNYRSFQRSVESSSPRADASQIFIHYAVAKALA